MRQNDCCVHSLISHCDASSQIWRRSCFAGGWCFSSWTLSWWRTRLCWSPTWWGLTLTNLKDFLTTISRTEVLVFKKLSAGVLGTLWCAIGKVLRLAPPTTSLLELEKPETCVWFSCLCLSTALANLDELPFTIPSNLREPVAVTRTKWKADPFARGCYSFAKVGKFPGVIVGRVC